MRVGRKKHVVAGKTLTIYGRRSRQQTTAFAMNLTPVGALARAVPEAKHASRRRLPAVTTQSTNYTS